MASTNAANRLDASSRPNERTGTQPESASQQFAISAPAISLPKGGGAIRGIGEKFAANPVTGTGSMSVPIAISPGRGGFGPQLSLSYDSGAGNGPFGLGWSLSIPSIRRKTDKGLPTYLDEEESDTFVLAGAEDLVPEMDAGPVIAKVPVWVTLANWSRLEDVSASPLPPPPPEIDT